MYERFHRLVDDLIDLSAELRTRVPLATMSIDAPMFVMEHGTVQADCGRQVGKTMYIKKRVQPGDLVLTYNGSAAGHFGLDRRFSVMTAPQAMSMKEPIDRETGLPFKRIFIDEPRFTLKRYDREAVYRKLVTKHDQLVIILGS